MRAPLLLVMVGACGGGSKAAPTPVEPVISATPTTRVPIEDDDQEEGVQIINARGRMDPAVVEQGIGPHKQALSECYTGNLSKRRWLGGQVVLHWDINKEGVVTGVHLAETEAGTNLGNWPMEKCILEVARAAVFGKPIGGDADFQIPLEFAARGKFVSWDEDKALRAVGGQTVKLDACAKGKVPAPEGLTVTVYVGAAGKAQSVGFSGKSIVDDAWAECAEKAAMAWRLPDPKGMIAKLQIHYR